MSTPRIFVTCRSQKQTGVMQICVEDKGFHSQPLLDAVPVPASMVAHVGGKGNFIFVQLPRRRER